MTGLVGRASRHDHRTVIIKLVAEVVQTATQIEGQFFLLDQTLIPTRTVIALQNLDQQRHSWEVRRVLRRYVVAGRERRQIRELVGLLNLLLFSLRRLG